MKQKSLIIIGLAAAAVLSFGWAGLAVLALLFNPAPAPAIAGEDYAVINATTAAALVAANSYVKEQLWIRNICLGSEPSYDETPFADGMIGRLNYSDKPNQTKIKKGVVEIMDLRKIRGTTVNIPTIAGIGGEGVGGEGRRQGSEADIVTGNFQVTIGKHFFAVGIKQNAIDETVIQDTWSQTVNYGLRARHNKKKSDSIFMRVIQASATTDGAPNLLFPSGVGSRADLVSSNVVDTPLIARAGDYLPGLGAVPMDTTDDSGGSLGELFMFMSSNKALVNLSTENALLESLKHGWDRGAKNPIFKGGFTEWNGHGIYRWIHRDHANRYSIGSPLLPRAKLGVALTGANTGSIIKGGGRMYRTADDTATYKPAWFQFFSNSPFSFYGDVNNVVADTATTRYLLIINPTGNGFAGYTYKVNDGNTITILARMDLSAEATASGLTQTYTHPVGSLIVECNVQGTTFGRSLMFGAQFVASGIGSINGNPADPQVGKRIVEKRDYENDIGVGVEGVWGCAAVQRAGDNAYTGFVVIEHAVHVDGAPTIT